MINYDTEKRINVMVKHHGFIEYQSRDFNNALLACKDIEILNDVLDSIKEIRTKLIDKGATKKQIYRYDSKVRECFNKSINIIRNRTNSPSNNYIKEDLEILDKILQLDIDNYHNKNRWKS